MYGLLCSDYYLLQGLSRSEGYFWAQFSLLPIFQLFQEKLCIVTFPQKVYKTLCFSIA